jgi:type 1 glutamine amidotransferase/sugar phosphate isomerase/epimerase
MAKIVDVLAASIVLGVSLSGQAPPEGQRNPRSGPAPNPMRGVESVRWDAEANLRMSATSLLGWKVGLAASTFPDLSFFTTLERTDALNVSNVEASSLQKVNIVIPKDVDDSLQAGEIQAIQQKLLALNLRMPGYDVPAIGQDEDSIRKLFDFAKALGVETIETNAMPNDLSLVDKIASEYAINVAIRGNLDTVLDALQGHSSRLGISGDTGAWLQAGITPLDALSKAKDRLLVVHLGDRNALGPKGHAVELGTGAGNLSEFLSKMYEMNVKPSIITVDATGETASMESMSHTLDAFEDVLRPLAAVRVDEISRSTAIHNPDLVSAEEKKAIDDALPAMAPVTPKKPRKLLVLDLNVGYGGHRSIPEENYAIQKMGETTGAYTAVFSNDLDNLTYPKIKEYDAIFLNNTVGLLFEDPKVREGLLRFVREGGGLGGNHGVTYAAMDWREFHEMIGATRGVNRINNNEKLWIKITDPKSPLNAPFHGQEFEYSDEFYRFVNPPGEQFYSREKVHELLSVDVARTDMSQGPVRFPAQPIARADADYAVSWIRGYGQGRVFMCILGHNPTLFTTPSLAQSFLAGIQYILGDLQADATPSAKLSH